MATRANPIIQDSDTTAPNENRGGRTRFSWKDLAVALSSATFLLLWYRYPISNADEGLILSGAERILHGQVPYRDFFSELGPGSFYIQAAFFHLVGSDLAVVRVTVWILGVTLVWLVYRLGLKLLDGPVSFFPPIMVCLICYPALYCISHHWWGVLFFGMALLSLADCFQTSGPGQTSMLRLRLLLAGVLTAATLLCMQSLGVYGMAALLVWILFVERLTGDGGWGASLRRGVGNVPWFLLGTSVLLGLVMLYFWQKGALGAWVCDNFIFLLTNYRPYENSPGIYSYERWVRLLHWVGKGSLFHNGVQFIQFYFFAALAPWAGFACAIWHLAKKRVADISRRNQHRAHLHERGIEMMTHHPVLLRRQPVDRFEKEKVLYGPVRLAVLSSRQFGNGYPQKSLMASWNRASTCSRLSGNSAGSISTALPPLTLTETEHLPPPLSAQIKKRLLPSGNVLVHSSFMADPAPRRIEDVQWPQYATAQKKFKGANLKQSHYRF